MHHYDSIFQKMILTNYTSKKFGTIKAVNPLGNSLVIEYSNRMQAERAMKSTGFIYNNSPLNMEWFEGQIPDEEPPKATDSAKNDMNVNNEDELVVTF